MEKEIRAYICSPLTAPTKAEMRQNMLRARKYMQEIKKRYGYRTYAPHAYLPELLDDHIPEERALALSFGMELLKHCQLLIICEKNMSRGMYAEFEAALQHGLDVYACDVDKDYALTPLMGRRHSHEMCLPV